MRLIDADTLKKQLAAMAIKENYSVEKMRIITYESWKI